MEIIPKTYTFSEWPILPEKRVFQGVSHHSCEGAAMPSDKVCKTVHQYNKEPVSSEDMQRLLDIAEDFRKVKNYVDRKSVV